MKLLQVAQHAEDLDRASAFYADLLGSPPSARFDPPGLLFFDLGGTRLLLSRESPSSLFYLGVRDVEATVERMRDRAEIISEPGVIYRHVDDSLGPAGTEEWQAFLLDSEGNTVGLVTQLPG
jgi:methylmalonyl-CoA/ethylmalonyl-CoA epimerase